MNQQLISNESLVISYLSLRRMIGIIGMALPFVLIIGKIVVEGPNPKIQASISSYYYTSMGDVFVGSLWAFGVFLWSYRGYNLWENRMGDAACIFALGVALFPTTPEYNATSSDKFVGALHLISASLFFLTLAYFSLCLFTKTKPNETPTPRKKKRNVIYIVCGWIMLVSVALIVVVKVMPDNPFVKNLDPVFWLESIAIEAFGVSWFIKGKTILQDQEMKPGTLKT